MPTYDYKCLECDEEYEIRHSIHDDAYEKYECPKCSRETDCERLISGGSGTPIWKAGDSKRQINKSRGYTGKFQNKLRPAGTSVDAPANKREADMQFQKFLDSGGLEGIEPSIDLNKSAGKPQTAEEMIDPKYKPK